MSALETPDSTVEKMAALKPVFDKNGTVTPGNASSINDAAAAVVLMDRESAQQRGLRPLGRLVAYSYAGVDPKYMGIGPVPAVRSLLDKTGLKLGDIDLFEVNEAFAVVPMVAMRDLDIPHDKLNIHGGACALGHPIGASGARVLVTLLNALDQHGLKRGVASLCIGGGEATAVALELIR